MKTFRLTTEHQIEKPLDEVFSFFSDAHNLVELTPPRLHLEVLTSVPIEMEVGTLIDYSLKLRGIPVRWQTEITEWEPPYFFADEQRKGPYRCWIHKHTFVETDGGTLVGDDVEYAMLGGKLINKLIVRPDLEDIFAYRSQKLKKLLS